MICRNFLIDLWDRIKQKSDAILKDVDEIAYVRFASVYREFKDVSTFMEEIKKILDS